MEIVISVFITLVILIGFLGLTFLVHKVTDTDDEDFLLSVLSTFLFLFGFIFITAIVWLIMFGS